MKQGDRVGARTSAPRGNHAPPRGATARDSWPGATGSGNCRAAHPLQRQRLEGVRSCRVRSSIRLSRMCAAELALRLDRAGDRGQHELRILQRLQRHPPHTVRKSSASRDAASIASRVLPGPARPGQRDEPSAAAADQVEQVGQLALPADERRRLQGQIRRRRPRARPRAAPDLGRARGSSARAPATPGSARGQARPPASGGSPGTGASASDWRPERYSARISWPRRPLA